MAADWQALTVLGITIAREFAMMFSRVLGNIQGWNTQFLWVSFLKHFIKLHWLQYLSRHAWACLSTSTSLPWCSSLDSELQSHTDLQQVSPYGKAPSRNYFLGGNWKMNGRKKCLGVCILWPYLHCTFMNFLYLLVMVRTPPIPLPLTSMVRMKCITKVTSWLRGGRSWTDSVPSGPSKGRRVKSPSFPFSVYTKAKIHLP